MLKFFRHIRQKLLIDSKLNRYLLYAIGEIFLVVIGILIALQVNTWNENRKLRKQERIYLQNLRDDMKAQINQLDIYIDFENIIIEQSNDIIRHYEANMGFKNMDTLFAKLNDLSVRWTFTNANTTLIQMINSNQINLIRNSDLKKELVDFNQQMDLFAKNTNLNNTTLVDNFTLPFMVERGSFASYGYSDRMEEKFKDFYEFTINKVADTELERISTHILNSPENRLELINKVVYRNTMATMQKNGNLTIKKRAEQLLHAIETEIERNE